MRSQFQRTYDIDTAITRAKIELNRLHLSAELNRLTDPEMAYHIHVLALYNQEGQVCARGSGKGVGQQAEASAFFEALEHFYMVASNHNQSSGSFTVRSVADVAAQPSLMNDYLIQRMARAQPQSQVGCGLYQACVETHRPATVWYPLAIGDIGYHQQPLAGDTFDYEPFLRYCSTSGIASGVTPYDAILHSLLELIERDSISLALLGWYIGQCDPVRQVNLNSLPPDLQQLAEHIQQQTGVSVVLTDIQSDSAIPAYLAFAGQQQTEPISLVGSGAAWSASYAAERALGELLQDWYTHHYYGSSPQRLQKHARLGRWPALQRCMTLSWDWLRNYLSVTEINLPTVDRDLYSPDSIKDDLLKKLADNGLHVFWRQITPPESAICVVHLIIPGIETFALVRTGHPLLPTGRGYPLWKTYLNL